MTAAASGARARLPAFATGATGYGCARAELEYLYQFLRGVSVLHAFISKFPRLHVPRRGCVPPEV